MEYFNGKVKVFDNVLQEQQIEKWKYFYENNVSFKRATDEYPNSSVYFCSNLNIKENIEVFDYENTIVPYAKQIDSKVTNKTKRSYLNLFTHCDTFIGHMDAPNLPNDKFWVSTVLFLSPDWDSNEGGLQFTQDENSVIIENVFNRLICFTGDMHHCVQPFNAHRARLTHYCTFSDIDYTSRIANRNRW